MVAIGIMYVFGQLYTEEEEEEKMDREKTPNCRHNNMIVTFNALLNQKYLFHSVVLCK